MNQHLLWPFRRSGRIIRSSRKAVDLLNVSSSVSAYRKSSSIHTFQMPAGSMFEVDDMGLSDISHNAFGHSSPKFMSAKFRQIANDVTQQGFAFSHRENYNENKLINEWISNQRKSKCYNGEAVFVLGPMGAGKTTVLLEEFRRHSIYKDYAYVDTDELMEKLDGFDSDKVEEFYPSARSIAIKLTDWLLNERISFVAEGTCVKYLELEDYMQRLKNKGYVIRVKHVNEIPLEEILKRTSKRKRKIAEEVVESIYYGSMKGVMELKKLNINNNLFEEL